MDQWILCARDYSRFETRNGEGEDGISAPAVPHPNKFYGVHGIEVEHSGSAIRCGMKIAVYDADLF